MLGHSVLIHAPADCGCQGAHGADKERITPRWFSVASAADREYLERSVRSWHVLRGYRCIVVVYSSGEPRSATPGSVCAMCCLTPRVKLRALPAPATSDLRYELPPGASSRRICSTTSTLTLGGDPPNSTVFPRLWIDQLS